MRKQVLIPVMAVLAIAIFICCKFGPVHRDMLQGVPAAVPDIAAAPVSTSSSATQEPVAPVPETMIAVADTNPSSGLITLRLNPGFSTQLPSVEDQKAALAMNEKFTKTNGQ